MFLPRDVSDQADRWYFAYGSNLLAAQMVARTGPIATGEDAPRIAHLSGYRLAFNMLSEDGRVYANIARLRANEAGGVTGVIYLCTAETLTKLDSYERGYVRCDVGISDQHGRSLAAVAYISRPETTAPPSNLTLPTDEYLGKILTGARQHGLPAAYIRRVEALGRGRSAVRD